MTPDEKEKYIDRVERMLEYREEDPHVEPLDDITRHRKIDELLAAQKSYRPVSEDDSPEGGLFEKRTLIGIAAGLALAAGIAIVMIIGELPAEHGMETGTAVASAPTPLEARLVMGNDPSVISVGEKITIVAGKEAGFSFASATTDSVEVKLKSGELFVIVDPIGERPKLIIRTSSGRVAVTGTVFGVSATKNDTQVEVFRGSVELVADGQDPRRLASSYAAMLGSPDTSPLDPRRLIRVRDMADEVVRLTQAKDVEALSRIDYDEAFTTGRIMSSPIPGAEAHATTGTDTPSPVVDKKTKEYRVVPPKVTPQMLLRKAREAKSNRDWKGAARTYKELIRSYPDSPESAVALVSLASLELGVLNRPSAALGRYERYLAQGSGGSLAVEARWGRALALRKLGRKSDERVALTRFVALFPGAFQAGEAKKRLAEIDSAN